MLPADINLGIPARGSRGLKGDKGNRGFSVWTNKYARGTTNNSYWSDLYGTSIGNGPQVGDLTIQPDGTYYLVTSVKVSNSITDGGGTFTVGTRLGSLQGPKGNTGDRGPQGPPGQNANDTTHSLQSGDFNNIRTNGYYETNGTFANSPLNGEWGDLSVIAGEHYTRQVWTKGDSGEMFIRSRKYNSNNWTPWYKIGTYEASPNWTDQTVTYFRGVVVNGICDLHLKVRITSSQWHDLLHGLPEAAEKFTFWWNGENNKFGKFSMNGNALACRADQEDDYDVHLTYAVKM